MAIVAEPPRREPPCALGRCAATPPALLSPVRTVAHSPSSGRHAMSQSSAPRALGRRGFLQLLAGAVGAVPVVAAAQSPPAPPPAATTPPAPTGPEHSGGEARLLAEVLRTRYPDRF